MDKINPDLVIRDKEGKPYSVRYDQVNAMLLNEFLKEHRKVEKHRATIAELKSTVTKQEAAITQQRKDFDAAITELKNRMETFIARSKEHDAEIQRINDEIEMSRPARQLVKIPLALQRSGTTPLPVLTRPLVPTRSERTLPAKTTRPLAPGRF